MYNNVKLSLHPAELIPFTSDTVNMFILLIVLLNLYLRKILNGGLSLLIFIMCYCYFFLKDKFTIFQVCLNTTVRGPYEH